jgi:hypothetical protein
LQYITICTVMVRFFMDQTLETRNFILHSGENPAKYT